MKTKYQANNLILEIKNALARNSNNISTDLSDGFRMFINSLEQYNSNIEEFEQIVNENTATLQSEQSKAISLLSVDWADDKVTSKMIKGIIEKQK